LAQESEWAQAMVPVQERVQALAPVLAREQVPGLAPETEAAQPRRRR
jgi:hypothetical protein